MLRIAISSLLVASATCLSDGNDSSKERSVSASEVVACFGANAPSPDAGPQAGDRATADDACRARFKSVVINGTCTEGSGGRALMVSSDIGPVRLNCEDMNRWTCEPGREYPVSGDVLSIRDMRSVFPPDTDCSRFGHDVFKRKACAESLAYPLWLGFKEGCKSRPPYDPNRRDSTY